MHVSQNIGIKLCYSDLYLLFIDFSLWPFEKPDVELVSNQVKIGNFNNFSSILYRKSNFQVKRNKNEILHKKLSFLK